MRVRGTPYLTIIRPEHGWNLAVYASLSTGRPLHKSKRQRFNLLVSSFAMTFPAMPMRGV